MEERFRVEVGARFAVLLDLSLERLWGSLLVITVSPRFRDRRVFFSPIKARPLDAPMKYESEFSTPRSRGDAWMRNVSSFGGDAESLLALSAAGEL